MWPSPLQRDLLRPVQELFRGTGFPRPTRITDGPGASPANHDFVFRQVLSFNLATPSDFNLTRPIPNHFLRLLCCFAAKSVLKS
jgi:hypothetical protein